MIKELQCFCLYANCIPIKGYMRSIILDLQNSRYTYIPNQLYFLLESFRDTPFNDILKNYPDFRLIIEEYFHFLIVENLGHYLPINKSSMFPQINFEYNYPSEISNCIIEISKASKNEIVNKLIREFSGDLSILNYLILIHPSSSVENLKYLLSNFECIQFNNLEVISTNQGNGISSILEEFYDLGIISKYSIYKGENANKNHCDLSLRLSNSSCAQICIERMIVNMEFYSESISNNTCLHRKLSIDAHGNIKNCPSCTQSFGNIKDTTLQQALEHPDFKKYWNITKDQIDVCKDCEFRHMCTDCRVFIKDPENPYSQPSKCTYNPYIAKWQGEEGYVPVEECGTYTRETGFVVNHEWVAALNQELWGE